MVEYLEQGYGVPNGGSQTGFAKRAAYQLAWRLQETPRADALITLALHWKFLRFDRFFDMSTPDSLVKGI